MCPKILFSHLHIYKPTMSPSQQHSPLGSSSSSFLSLVELGSEPPLLLLKPRKHLIHDCLYVNVGQQLQMRAVSKRHETDGAVTLPRVAIS